MFDVELIGVSKKYGSVTVVDGISLQVHKGEFLTLLGPSGCGKTTTLNMVAGFVEPSSGKVLIKGHEVEHLPPYRRDTAMVFQQYALFPHMTVRDNIGFGLKMKGIHRDEIRRRIDAALEQVKLTGMGDRSIRQLSGGQQQRVALARAIVVEPTVLLMDEPLSNLDQKLREAMRIEIKELQRRLGITAIYVTHDQGESLTMSDRIAVLNAGRIEQIGSPLEIYKCPRTRFVADFIGTTNLLQGRAVEVADRQLKVRTPAGLVVQAAGGDSLQVGQEVTVSIRPEHLRISRQRPAIGNNFHGIVQQATFMGSVVRHRIKLESGEAVIADALVDGGETEFISGEEVFVFASPEHCVPLGA